jgi:tetratricopeptide (TPR) repeat protein
MSRDVSNERRTMPTLKILPRLLMLVFLFSAITVVARAEDAQSSFEAANKLYDQGKFAEADTAYEQLISAGDISPALLFNRGNALFKLGHLGRAIASYLQAERLAPRDPDIRANLQLARTRARGGSPYHANRLTAPLTYLTLNEWTALTVAAFWLFFIQLAAIQWQPDLKLRLTNGIYCAALAVVFFAVCLGYNINRDYFTNSVVVISGEVEVRNGPLDEAPSVFKVRDGAELEIVDQKDNWFQVVDPSQRVGWIPQSDVLRLGPATMKAKVGIEGTMTERRSGTSG